MCILEIRRILWLDSLDAFAKYLVFLPASFQMRPVLLLVHLGIFALSQPLPFQHVCLRHLRP